MCQVAWKLGKTPRDWQTGVIIPIFKKGDRKQCTNYRGISLLSLPGKVYAKCLERKCREIVESKLEDGQCGFRPGRSTTDQIFTLKQIFEKSWEYGKDLFACFVDLEKAYNRVSRDKLWKVLQEYGVDGQLLHAIKLFYYIDRGALNLDRGTLSLDRGTHPSLQFNYWIQARRSGAFRSCVPPHHCLYPQARNVPPKRRM